MSQHFWRQPRTSAIEKVSGDKLFYTKSGHFCTLILAPTLEENFRKFVGYLTSIVTMNEFKLPEE
jgi:hypothetical protein